MQPGLSQLRNPLFLVMLGDQVAAGRNATGLNAVGGKGYGRLLLNNHPDYPEWNGRDLATWFPGLAFVDLSRDGATASLARAHLERSLVLMALPDFIEGDLIVLIHVGGNDFFPRVLLEPETIEDAAAFMRTNLAMMISLLRMRYEKPQRAVVVLVSNIIDPTDGVGSVPEDFQEGACRWLQPPRAEPHREQMLDTLDYFNAQLAQEAEARGAWLVDAHSAFLGHGLNAGDERWLDTDGQRLLDAGHHALRQLAWSVLTQEPRPMDGLGPTQTSG